MPLGKVAPPQTSVSSTQELRDHLRALEAEDPPRLIAADGQLLVPNVLSLGVERPGVLETLPRFSRPLHVRPHCRQTRQTLDAWACLPRGVVSQTPEHAGCSGDAGPCTVRKCACHDADHGVRRPRRILTAPAFALMLAMQRIARDAAYPSIIRCTGPGSPSESRRAGGSRPGP